MQWTSRKWNVGDERERSGFLIFPRTVNICDSEGKVIKKETRWLEYATWVEKLWEGGCSRIRRSWQCKRFL